jgi:hypothetical protein
MPEAATAVSFFIPRTPVAQSREGRSTPYRNQSWQHWVSALRLWGQGIGPIKEPIDYPVKVSVTVRWPKCGNQVEDWHPGYWRRGVEGGLARARLVPTELIKSVAVGWELVGVSECGTLIEIEQMEEHSDV